MKTVQVAFRLDPKLVALLDRHAESLSVPGVKMSRSDAVRAILVAYLKPKVREK